jgi:hypothetical protein
MAQSASPILFRDALLKILEDPISTDLMNQAVTLIPCGHTLNENIAIQCIARDKLCPLDKKPIDRHIPNYIIRDLVETNNQHPIDKPPTQEAYNYFQQGKTLFEQKDYEGAIKPLLKALQISSAYEEAQRYLDFCLYPAAKISSRSPALASFISLPTPEKNSSFSKETYIEQLLRLIDHPHFQKHASLKSSLEALVEELMKQESEELTSRQKETHTWFQKLIIDNKVSEFVAKKLQQLIPIAAQPPSLPSIACGAAEWKMRFGDVGIEPPLPANIEQILNAPCPIWPDKKVMETHLLTLIPQTVNTRHLTLKTLEQLVQNPLQGNPTAFSYVESGRYQDPPASASHWALVTKDVLPDSRCKSYEQQQCLIQSIPGYEVPKVLDMAIVLFMEYVRNGYRLYSDNPQTYTRCQERHSAGYQVSIGCFSLQGLGITKHGDFDGNGMGAIRRL